MNPLDLIKICSKHLIDNSKEIDHFGMGYMAYIINASSYSEFIKVDGSKIHNRKTEDIKYEDIKEYPPLMFLDEFHSIILLIEKSEEGDILILPISYHKEGNVEYFTPKFLTILLKKGDDGNIHHSATKFSDKLDEVPSEEFNLVVNMIALLSINCLHYYNKNVGKFLQYAEITDTIQ